MRTPAYFQRFFLMQASEIDNFKAQFDNTGIFLTAYRYANKEQQGELWADELYHDFDDKDLAGADGEEVWKRLVVDVRHAVSVYEVFYGISPDLMRFYFSGKKGVSMMIPGVCLGYKPHEHLNTIFHDIIMEVSKYVPNKTLDTRIYDRIRLWRVVNSIHNSSGYYKIPITFNELKTLTLAQIQEMANQPRFMEWPSPRPVPKAVKKMADIIKAFNPNRGQDKLDRVIKVVPPCINSLLETTVGHGSRNNTAAAIASFFRQHGLSEDETKQRMREWNAQCCTPSMDGRELASTISSVYRGNKTWGCTALRELGAKCDTKTCQLAKKEEAHGARR